MMNRSNINIFLIKVLDKYVNSNPPSKKEVIWLDGSLVIDTQTYTKFPEFLPQCHTRRPRCRKCTTHIIQFVLRSKFFYSGNFFYYKGTSSVPPGTFGTTISSKTSKNKLRLPTFVLSAVTAAASAAVSFCSWHLLMRLAPRESSMLDISRNVCDGDETFFYVDCAVFLFFCFECIVLLFFFAFQPTEQN